MLIDTLKKTIKLKIVYYGIAQSGKTTNVDFLAKYHNLNLLSFDTKGERTLVFDFVTKRISFGDMQLSFAIYTTPGQGIYKDIRKTVMKGVDGIIYVVDSQKERLEENINFIEVLKQDLRFIGRRLEDVPLIFQYNKLDLPNALDPEILEQEVNIFQAPSTQAVAIKGIGVAETFDLMVEELTKKIKAIV